MAGHREYKFKEFEKIFPVLEQNINASNISMAEVALMNPYLSEVLLLARPAGLFDQQQ